MPPTTKVSPFRVAFLFLVRDDVNFPALWENYFRGHDNQISLYCHPKNKDQVQTGWLKDTIIEANVPTAWGHITDAYFHLIHTALQNPENQKFVVVSESCVPARPFSEFYDFLGRDDYRASYIKLFDFISNYDERARIGQENIRGRWNAEDVPGLYNPGSRSDFPYFTNARGEDIAYIKHYARFCLSRHHALQLFGYDEGSPIPDRYVPTPDQARFNAMEVGDEFFLSILNTAENRPLIRDKMITFDNWERVKNEIRRLKAILKKLPEKSQEAKKIQADLDGKFSGANPYSYETVNALDIVEARETGCFFWRKFPPGSNIDQLAGRMMSGGRRSRTRRRPRSARKTRRRRR